MEQYSHPGDDHNLAGSFSLAMSRTIQFFDLTKASEEGQGAFEITLQGGDGFGLAVLAFFAEGIVALPGLRFAIRLPDKADIVEDRATVGACCGDPSPPGRTVRARRLRSLWKMQRCKGTSGQ